MTDYDAIIRNLPWSEPKLIETKAGLRTVSNAPVPESLQPVLSDRQFLRAHNLTASSFRGKVGLTRWGSPAQTQIDAINARIQASQATSSDFAVPAPAGKDYLPFQRAGIQFILDPSRPTPNALLGDDMGLGKSVQAAGVINAQPDIKRVLVVCPDNLKVNWRRELKGWLVRDLSVGIVKSGKWPETDIVVINYENVGKFREMVDSVNWDLVAVDEAHNLKNREAKRTKMIFGWRPTTRQATKVMNAVLGDGVSPEEAQQHIESMAIPPVAAKRKLLLSGTPISNRPKELFTLLHYLYPEVYRNFFSYSKRYCDAKQKSVGRGRSAWDHNGASNLEELQRRLRSTIMVRRLKSEVLPELPPKRRVLVELDSSELPQLVAQGLADYQKIEKIKEEAEALRAKALSSTDPKAYEKQIAALGNAEHMSFEGIAKLRLETGLAKVPVAIERIAATILDNPEYKLVVFAYHREVIEKLHEAFKANSVILVGGMGDKADESVRRFQEDPSIQVFFGQLDAASVGHTLTASSHVMFVEEHWVPVIITQAEDRLCRIGQRYSVLVEHLVFADSIDVKMAQGNIAKQEVITKAIDNPELAKTASAPAMRTEQANDEPPLPVEVVALVHEALRQVAGVCDGAHARDGKGFSGADAYIGRQLALRVALSPRQAKLGLKLVRKYHGQLPGVVERLTALGIAA